MPGKILEVCKVTPSPDSPTDISLPLAFFDLLWLRHSSPESLLFYEFPHPEPLISSSIIPKLKHSLSQTLRHFLPLAGNITWTSSSPSPVIRYKKGDGVLFTIVVSDDDFHHLSGTNKRECGGLLPLVAHIVGSDSQVPVLAVKVSIFPNKGFCLGITPHHGALDAISTMLFIKSWASISKFGITKAVLDPKLAPIFCRELVREQYVEIENSYIEILKQNKAAQNSLAIRQTEPLPDRVRGTFTLSGLGVRKLKELQRDRAPYISTFAVTYAYLILCVLRAKEQTDDNRVFVGFPVDIRGRLEPPLPANYFGNCVVFCDAILDREQLMGTEGVSVIMNFINKSIKDLENGVKNKIKQLLSNAFKERNPDDIKATRIYVVGSSKLGVNQIDFGWGRPKKADTTLVDYLSAMYLTQLEDGAVEVELSLNKHEMERFSYEFTQGLDNMMKHKSAAL